MSLRANLQRTMLTKQKLERNEQSAMLEHRAEQFLCNLRQLREELRADPERLQPALLLGATLLLLLPGLPLLALAALANHFARPALAGLLDAAAPSPPTLDHKAPHEPLWQPLCAAD